MILRIKKDYYYFFFKSIKLLIFNCCSFSSFSALVDCCKSIVMHGIVAQYRHGGISGWGWGGGWVGGGGAG